MDNALARLGKSIMDWQREGNIMSTLIVSRKEIPDAPCYVLCNDRVFSGWGQSPNKTNVCILPCKDWAEAIKVSDYAKSRREMRYVRIVGEKPRLYTDRNTYSLFDRNHASAWYR